MTQMSIYTQRFHHAEPRAFASVSLAASAAPWSTKPNMVLYDLVQMSVMEAGRPAPNASPHSQESQTFQPESGKVLRS